MANRHLAEQMIEQVESRAELLKPKEQHQLLNIRFQFIIEKYNDYLKRDFLRAIIHNL